MLRISEIFTEPKEPDAVEKIVPKSATIERAQQMAEAWDASQLESEWRHTHGQQNGMPEKPSGSFTGYVKWYVPKHGSAR